MNKVVLRFVGTLGNKSYQIEPPEFEIDYTNSKAFTRSFYETSIYINPILQPKERGRVKKELIQKLKKLKDPETNENVFKGAYENRKIYKGPFVNISPDIFLFQMKIIVRLVALLFQIYLNLV
jgi:predicted AlkP superfamily phosphohydrolase/phosphomutase